MGHFSKIGVAFLRILQLSPLLLVLIGGPAAAQIQLTAPADKGRTWTAQLVQPGNAQQPETPPASSSVPPAAQENGQKPAPPDFSIVDRATGVEAAPKLEGWASELNDIEQTLNAAFVSYAVLDRARGRLEEIRGEIDKFLAILTPKVAEAKAQVDNLGPVPEAGDPEPVAAQRGELQTVFGSLSAVRNIADSTKLRASQLTARVQEIRRKKFAERLFEHVPEAHSAYTWESAPRQFGFALQKTWQTVSAWWEHLDRRSDAIQILIVGLLIAALTGFASTRGVRHFRRWDLPGEPPFWLRSTSAAWVTLLRVMPFAATSTFLYYSFRYQGLMPENVDLLANSAMRSLLIVTAVCALVATALAPVRSHWRLLPMDDRAARNIRWLVVALAAVYSLTLFLDTVRYVSNAPFTLTIAQSFVSSIIIAVLVVAILMTPRNPLPVQDAPEIHWIAQLRWPLWGVALIILLTALTGYIGLAKFISAQLIVTGTIVAVLYLLLLWVDAVGESMGNEEARLGQWLTAKAGLDQRRREQLSLPVTMLLKSAVLLVTVPLILLQWGFDWKDIREWSDSLLFGFKVGEIEISIAAIIASIVVFILGYLLARIFQSWLDRRVLETAGLSGGARHSVRTAVGYFGVLIAALLAISYAGLDLSNVALVAGALSVGIGLGLQGVVNNFVSGLILLVERPIKVGDWVVVGGEEGIVKKISVRATEVETFDRATVLIPNSLFISEKVKNWTLHNYSGRVQIKVGVHYTSKPRQVHDILLEVARADPNVMTNPEPFVYFGDFAADALEFTLYAYTYDITKSLRLRTELRMAIAEAFQREGIEIPYRQTDIHFRDEWFRNLLDRQNSQAPKAESHAKYPAPIGRASARQKP
jgi:small-conductance mechanosensitive channel